jgi:regulator of sirC expression with transglutaminase-like and TPR domain
LIDSLQLDTSGGRKLLSQEARKLDHQAQTLRKLASTLHQQQIHRELLRLFEAPEEKIDLLTAGLLVAKLDNDDIDIETYQANFDMLAGDLAARFSNHTTEKDKLKALNDFLFVENGFHGSRADYYDRANSYLNEVLDDREGIPITLSVVYLELGRRAGIKDLVGISLPGHFVVQHRPAKGPSALIDVFDGGRDLSLGEARAIAQLAPGDSLPPAILAPATKRQIIVRMLRNLIGISMQDRSGPSPVRYLDLIIALEPTAARERWTRSFYLLQMGDTERAKADLRWLIDNQPPDEEIDLERVERLFRSL